MKKPNFLIIGSLKSGTTSLYKYLSQHPQIGFSERKEPKYFCWKDLNLNFNGTEKVVTQIMESTVQKLEEYEELFKNIDTKYCGEASADYFHTKNTAKNIFKYNPQMKLIVILRNPSERAYSDWRHNVKMGYEPIRSFKKAIKAIQKRKSNNGVPYFDYLDKGNYSCHLKEYLSFFPSKNIKVLFFDDLKEDPGAVCNQVLTFLGIEGVFGFDTNNIYMKNTYTPKYYTVHSIAKKIGKFNKYLENKIKVLNGLPSVIPSQERSLLQNYYREDILNLENILEKDFNYWLN